MSSFEFNSGKLKPVSLSDDKIVTLCKDFYKLDEFPTWANDWNDFFDENMYEMGYVKICDKIYEIIDHTCYDENEFQSQIFVDKFGVISFLTYHYNGGAHWTEVIEDELEK